MPRVAPLMLLALALFSGRAEAACTTLFDNTDHSTNLPGLSTNYQRVMPTSGGNVTSITVWINDGGGSPEGVVGLYSSTVTDDAPNALLASSAYLTYTAGLNTITIPTVAVNNSTYYWVAVSLSDINSSLGTQPNVSCSHTTGSFLSTLNDPYSDATLPCTGVEDIFVQLNDCSVAASPTNTPLAGSSATDTPVAGTSPTDTPSSSATPSATPSYSPAAGSPTFTPTATSSATPSPSDTPTRTATPSGTPSFTVTPTFTVTSSPTQTRTVTPSGTPTFTITPSSTPCGNLSTIAGTGTASSTGDGLSATAATLNNPSALAVDNQGRLVIAESNGNLVRRVGTNGIIQTLAGTGSAGAGADGVSATASAINQPWGLAVDGGGAVYFSDRMNHRVRRVDPVTGLITTVAGTGVSGVAGLTLTASATGLALNQPTGLAIASNGDLYIADSGNHAIRKVSTAGLMSLVAGTGVAGFNGAGVTVTAATAQFNRPLGISFDLQGRLLIADTDNHALRRLEGGIVRSLAGTGSAGFSLVNLVASGAALSSPTAAVVDGRGDIFISELGAHSVRKIATDGYLGLAAGTGATGAAVEGAQATASPLSSPLAALVNGQGDLVIADSGHHRVRSVAGCGIAPFIRPGVPSCYYGVTLASLSRVSPKDVGGAPSFSAQLGPNPVVSGGELRLCYGTALAEGGVKIYDISGALAVRGGEVAGSCVVFKAPPAPGVYFVEAEAKDAWGATNRKLLKLAVVGR